MRKINMKKRSKKSNPKEETSEPVTADSEIPTDQQHSEESDHETVETENKAPKKRKSSSSSRKKAKKSKTKESKDTDADKTGENGTAAEESEGVEEQYEVEAILDEKTIRGVHHYLIRWKGYEPESDSWEPENTVTCPDLIAKFRDEHKNGSNRRSKKTKSEKKKNKKQKRPKLEWESDEEFEVERILEVHHKKNGNREFFVLWKGYPRTESTWEPEENLDCKDLIKKFMEKVDKARALDDKDLRTNRKATERFTLSTSDSGRRLSRRLGSKQRVQYHGTD